MRPNAFTLVELLVTISVIAVLLGVLLPSLAGARESAKLVSCLSNLRQAHQSIVVHAGSNKDRIPLGYRAGRKQWNSMVWSASSQSFVLFGDLYRRGYLSPPDVFFCPSETDPRSMLAVPENPWPPGPDGDPTKHTFAGYGARPEFQIPDDLSWTPRLSDFGHGAILADLTATVDRVDTRHKSGVNALRTDGSAQWTARAHFADPLEQCRTITPAANPHQDAIWKVLDQMP